MTLTVTRRYCSAGQQLSRHQEERAVAVCADSASLNARVHRAGAIVKYLSIVKLMFISNFVMHGADWPNALESPDLKHKVRFSVGYRTYSLWLPYLQFVFVFEVRFSVGLPYSQFVVTVLTVTRHDATYRY